MKREIPMDDAKDKPVRLRKEDFPQAVSQAVLRSVEGGNRPPGEISPLLGETMGIMAWPPPGLPIPIIQ